MNNRAQELLDRSFEFSIQVLQTIKKLPKDQISYVIINQIAKSCTSVGANYQEAQAAQSRKDFAHKLAVVCKECRETQYWLNVICVMYRGQDSERLKKECIELLKIFTTIKLKVAS